MSEDAYLDELRESMDLAVQDLGEADRNWEAEVMMQAATALDHLRAEVRSHRAHVRSANAKVTIWRNIARLQRFVGFTLFRR